MDVNIPKIGWSVLFTFVFFTDEYDVMTSGLYHINSVIVIYDCNDSGQYYKTAITIVFTILAKAKAKASLS